MALPSLTSIKKRTVIIVVLTFIMFALVIVRMFWWQIIKGNGLYETAKKMQTAETVEQANRGKILDRNGMVLAESVTVKTLVCNPQDVRNSGDADTCVKVLSPILGMSESKLEACFKVDAKYTRIKKRLSAEESKAIEELINPSYEEETNKEAKKRNEEKRELKNALSGIYFENDSKRYYPYNVASHVLGFTGYDNNGIQGVELIFDEYLTGYNGAVYQNRNASGTTIENQQAEYLKAAKSGCDVTLTIDENIQHFLEQHLEEAVLKNELKEGAAGIVMNPKTGEILAIATKPDFDCNDPYDISRFLEYAIEFEEETDDEATEEETDSEEEEEKDPDSYSDEFIGKARSKMWRDKAVSDTYEPGSTFKIITAAAALEENIVDVDTNFFCAGFKQVADRKISCANKSGHGAQTFAEGVKNSCNPVFMEVALAMGEEVFMNYFEAFGFTSKTGIELGGESSALYYDKMSEVDLATSSFGQGFQITPLQLITAVSATINGGERMRPTIVKEISNKDGVIKTYQPQVVNRVISEKTSQTMRELLEAVVGDQGATGKNAYVKGWRIGGKTGTSEKQPRGSDKRIASFIGFAPANDPELVCLIMLDEPQTANKFGGTIAAPVCGEVLSESLEYLGLEKQYAEDESHTEQSSVPELRNISLSSAKSKADEAGFTYKIKGSGDTVVDQLPKPQEMLDEGSVIILYTEERDETDMATVPDLKGYSVRDAKYMLNNAGLNFEAKGAGHSEAGNAYATSQTFAPGSKVLPGTVVGVKFGQQTND